jgi:phosphoribosyl 1,2-cyclic phosphodiesterase/DNA-binding NarL/FixJ family response regulator
MKTVLVIDDDRGARLVLQWAFKKAGWRVLQAEDGEVGLAMIAEHKPEVVVCDLMMPRCNGFQVCRAIRARTDKVRETKILISTASTYATDRQNAFEAGADDYLTKPIDPEEMLRLVKQLTSGGPSGTTFQFRKDQQPRNDFDTTSSSKPSPDQPVRVKFWGVRGSLPTPGPATAYYGGNTACVEVQADGERIILDAGTGIRPLGLEWMARYPDEPLAVTVLITHTHWDHIQGFPFFIPAYNPRNRIRILGYEGARKGLEQTLASQMESPYFPISMQEMPGHISIQELKPLEFTIGPIKVQAQFVNHPGICVGYRLKTSAGSIAFIPDNEPFLRLKSQTGIMTEKEAEAQLEYARSQDQKLVEFLRDVDILILDAQYDEQEYLKHVGWGHSCTDDAVNFALQAGVKQLFLFHHDPGHDDTRIAQMASHGRQIATAAGGKLKVEAAREGVEVQLQAKPAYKPAAVVAALG